MHRSVRRVKFLCLYGIKSVAWSCRNCCRRWSNRTAIFFSRGKLQLFLILSWFRRRGNIHGNLHRGNMNLPVCSYFPGRYFVDVGNGSQLQIWYQATPHLSHSTCTDPPEVLCEFGKFFQLLVLPYCRISYQKSRQKNPLQLNLSSSIDSSM